MRLEDYIHVEHKVISDELINQIINEYDSSSDWKPGTINDYEVKKNRKCEVIYLSNNEIIQKKISVRNDIDNKLFVIVNDLLEKYFKKYDSLGYINVKGDTGYMLLRYRVGDYVCEHVDTHSGQHRTLSCSIILNDNYEGGEIKFFNGKYAPTLVKGDMVVFPSSFTYPHQVTPVTSGIRYSIITWIR